MIKSIYTGMAGMVAFSKGLDNVSQNVSNLNTPGYKGTDLQFQDLLYQYQWQAGTDQNPRRDQHGDGVTATQTSLRLMQGEVRETGNANDLAIDGTGFFVLREGANTYYSRDGEFEFNRDGTMVTRGGNAQLMALDGAGKLQSINLNDYRAMEPKATTEIRFFGNLSSNSVQARVDDVRVYDNSGKLHKLRVTFSKKTADTPQWTVTVEYQDTGEIVAEGGEIHFDAQGAPEKDFNTFSFSFQRDAAPAQDIKLLFGEPGSFSASVSKPTNNGNAPNNGEIALKEQNGHDVGSLTDIRFDRDGQITFFYSNGEKRDGLTLALAWTDDYTQLQDIGRGRFASDRDDAMHIAAPTQQGLGQIVGKSIELSNVELTREFTDMIIIQRGYQAASQVITAANEMLQQTIEMAKHK